MYKINDMISKAIEDRQALAKRRSKQHLIPLPIGMHVKVLGILQALEGTRWLKILSICILEDMNKLSTHTLEIVDAHSTKHNHRKPVHSSGPSPNGSCQGFEVICS